MSNQLSHSSHQEHRHRSIAIVPWLSFVKIRTNKGINWKEIGWPSFQMKFITPGCILEKYLVGSQTWNTSEQRGEMLCSLSWWSTLTPECTWTAPASAEEGARDSVGRQSIFTRTYDSVFIPHNLKTIYWPEELCIFSPDTFLSVALFPTASPLFCSSRCSFLHLQMSLLGFTSEL